MAFSPQSTSSSDMNKVQTAMHCQLCENNSKLKWKCLECGLLMCQRCKDKVHPKFSSAENHTIIDIKMIPKLKPNPDLTKIKCGLHKELNYCLFCKSCQELVCQSCITKTHNKHEFGDIGKEYKIKMEKLRNGQKNTEKGLQTLTVSEQKMKQIKSSKQSNYDKAKKAILEYDKALVNEIKKHTDKLLKALDHKWEAISTFLDHELNKLKKHQNKIQKQIQEINNLLQFSNTKDVFSDSDSLLKSIETNVPSINTSFQGVPTFTPGDRTKISLILGKLEDVSIQYNSELKVDKTFETALTDITSMIFCPGGSLWICDGLSNIAQKVQLHGDSISVLSNIPIVVIDTALLHSGDLLLSVNGSSNLKLVPAGSTDIQDSVFTASPLQSAGVHVACNNNVLVGAVDSEVIPTTGPRQVIVMDQTGHHENIIQFDRHKKPLFTYPYGITSNSQGSIAITDLVSYDNKGRVVVLDNEGKVRNIYTGHPDVNNKDNPFEPTGITTTPSDNFIVADQENHTLHILNKEGEIITLYNTQKIEILLPYSLSFSTTGQLYIACGTDDDSEEKAKLYTVNNFYL